MKNRKQCEWLIKKAIKKIRVIVVLSGEFKQGMNGNICEASTES